MVTKVDPQSQEKSVKKKKGSSDKKKDNQTQPESTPAPSPPPQISHHRHRCCSLRTGVLLIAICSLVFYLVMIIVAVLILIHGADGGWRKGGLDEHNKARDKYRAPKMVLDDDMIDSAQACAEYLASKEITEHVCGKKLKQKDLHGENLWSRSGILGAEKAAVSATSDWVSEKDNYSTKTGTCVEGAVCGHFTQVIAKDATRLGLGYAVNDKKTAEYVVGHYGGGGTLGTAPVLFCVVVGLFF